MKLCTNDHARRERARAVDEEVVPDADVCESDPLRTYRTCSPCTDETVDVALFTSEQYKAFMAGTSNTATAVWNAQGSNATGSQPISVAGEFVLTFTNPSSNFVDRTVIWSRTVTREDAIRDVLLSTFSALRAANITYSSITNTFFSDWQHVRRVTQSLETLSATRSLVRRPGTDPLAGLTVPKRAPAAFSVGTFIAFQPHASENAHEGPRAGCPRRDPVSGDAP